MNLQETCGTGVRQKLPGQNRFKSVGKRKMLTVIYWFEELTSRTRIGKYLKADWSLSSNVFFRMM